MTARARTLDRLLRVAVGATLVLLLWPLRDLRFSTVIAITTHDAAPAAGPRLPTAPGAGLLPADRVRVVLLDGAGRDTAATMPAWNSVCARGLDLTLDVGFPTVSLPVQLALWTATSQQATGVLYHASGKPLPAPAASIPAQVPDSIAIAESSPYIIHSLGFARTLPPAGVLKPPPTWAEAWPREAVAAVASPTRLAFVHVLRIDTAGHRHGKRSTAWRDAATSADRILADLVAAAPDARWFVFADHDHIATGGHGSEERALRIVRACVAGPGVAVGRGGPIHIADLGRAIADSAGVGVDASSPARPLTAAIAAPVSDDDVLPRLPRGRVALALLVLAVAVVATAWGTRGRWWAGPWWWPVAITSLIVLVQTPTLSTPMIYKRVGMIMLDGFAPGLAVLAIALTFAMRQVGWRRAMVAQLALPIGGAIACWIVTGATGLWFGERVCPVVPRWTGWLPPVTFMAATAMAVAGLVALASAVLPGFDPSTPTGTSRSDHAAR